MESQMLWGKYYGITHNTMEGVQRSWCYWNFCDINKFMIFRFLVVNQYDCTWTGSANKYDRNLYYFVPEGMAITLVEYMYTNNHE